MKISKGQQRQIDIQKNIFNFKEKSHKNMVKNEFPPEEADLNERLAGFNAAMEPILRKYELALASTIRVLPDGRLAAKPVVVSTRKKVEPDKPKPADNIINLDK